MLSCCAAPEPEDEKKRAGEAATLLKGSEGALTPGGTINIYTWKTCGYLLQYFSVGLIYGGLPATTYGLFIAHLNVPAYISNAAVTLASFPWSFKVLFALVTDTLPIGGYRRRPWMMIGWSVACIFLIALAATKVPDPYYCFGADGKFDLHHICNPSAAHEGTVFAVLMMLSACGYVMSDVAADALTVAYGRREPQAQRGRTQTTAYLVRTCGQIFAQLLVGLGMNGPEYQGTFGSGLSFNAICAILAVPAAAMVPVTWYMVQEPDLIQKKAAGKGGVEAGMELKSKEGAAVGGEEVYSVGEYFSSARTLFSSRAMLEVVLFQFLSSGIGGIGTTAGPEIQRVWAGVENLQNQLFGAAGNLLFILGLWLVRERFLHFSWRMMLLITTILVNVIDVPFTFFTVFDVVRNQYFYLDDGLITAIPAAASFVVATYVIVEVAQPGTEGITYGVLTTAGNLGGPVASGLSNWIFSYWKPSLSDANNYVADTPSFRSGVAWSCFVGYVFTFIALGFLPLLPDQKEQTQARLASYPRHWGFALATLLVLLTALAYSLTVDFLSIIPSTSCLVVAGGPGC